MGVINDLASVAVKKIEADAAVKEARIKERSQSRELKVKSRAHKQSLKSQERDSRMREKEETKRVKCESRSAVAQTAMNAGTDALADVGKGAIDNVGAFLKDKDINVHVPGICKVSVKENDKVPSKNAIENNSYYVEGPEDNISEDDYTEGCESNVFSNITNK